MTDYMSRQRLELPKNPKEEVIAACDMALLSAPSEYPPDLPSSGELAGAPEWHSFEWKSWEIGEHIRQQLQRNPKLKADTDILDNIIYVIRCRNLRRGRQSFVMLLGFKGASNYADEIASFLNDPDVAGHALDTLLKMRVPGYASEVAPLLDAEQAWIRKKARTYLERYPRVA